MIITKAIALPKFRRDIKKLNKKHYPMSKIIRIINIIKQQNNNLLKRRFNDHALHGDLQSYRELHIENNLLLIYRIINESTLELTRCGSHDQLFK